MDRRPATKPGPDLRRVEADPEDSFDTATDSDAVTVTGTSSRLDNRVSGVSGASVDTLYDLGLPPGALADDVEDSDLDEPVPNAERLVAQAVALAGEDQDAATLVDRFWRFAPDEELIGFTPQEMLDAAREHRDLAEQRVPGELKLRIHEPAPEQQHTVVEIVTDDMPFLVDSVTALLTAQHLDVHMLVHPLVVVRREPLGKLTEVAADVEPDDAIDGDIVESWMRVEIDPIRDATARERLRREMQRVLTDVREAVEDWPKMRQRALSLADDLAAARTSDSRPPVPEKDITDSVELLRWLAHEHFTFLGYREYRLVEVPANAGGGPPSPDAASEAGTGTGERALEAVLGTGLGILRQDSTQPRSLSSLPPEAHEKVLEKRLLIITKANSRATVHRSAYLDYIGFKIFNDAGEVVGERRFLGLFSTAAYRTSVRELPVVRRKVAEVLERHQGRDRRQALREARDLLDAVGIPDPSRRLSEYPHQISGGMRQRALIAMALACKPRLLIADEPTTALDVTIQAQILTLLKELVDDSGTALIMITHDLGVVAGLCDTVNVLYGGKVVETAERHELFAQPRHPYTYGLLNSVPRLDSLRGEPLHTRPG